MLKILTRLLLRGLKISNKYNMGTFLDKPAIEKYNEHGSSKNIKYGVSTMQGWRVRMEDSHCAFLELPNGLTDWSFFGLFDGHAGGFVSAYLAENLLNSLLESKEFLESLKLDPKSIDYNILEKSIKEAFLQVDNNLKLFPKLEKGEDKSGSTAVAVLISPTHFIFINCGDSRAILCKSQTCSFSTEDHKPSKPSEKARIVKAGGSVLIQRVNGSLAVSRALGDFDYKNLVGKHPFEQLVSPEPDIHIEPRDPEKDEFIVLACDGIWDVMSSEDICKYVRNRCEISENLENVCNQVVDTCLQKGSRDNMSVILVTLDAAPQLNQKSIETENRLNSQIEAKVKEILDNHPNANLTFLTQELEHQPFDYPPGGGVSAKYQLIQTLFKQYTSPSNGQQMAVTTANVLNNSTAVNEQHNILTDNSEKVTIPTKKLIFNTNNIDVSNTDIQPFDNKDLTKIVNKEYDTTNFPEVEQKNPTLKSNKLLGNSIESLEKDLVIEENHCKPMTEPEEILTKQSEFVIENSQNLKTVT